MASINHSPKERIAPPWLEKRISISAKSAQNDATLSSAAWKSEVRSRRRRAFYGNWATRGLSSPPLSCRAMENGIIFGWPLQRALHPPLAERPDVFISSPSLFTYTSFTRFRTLSVCRRRRRRRAGPCHRRNVIREKPGSESGSPRARRSPDSRLIEDRLMAKSEITYLLFSIDRTKNGASGDGLAR